MRIERLNIADLRPAEKNTRIHNRKQIDELVRSFKKFGQIRPIVIDENNVIWCGNGFFEAAKQAGETQVFALRKTGLTEEEKRKLMLADNQTFMLGAVNSVVMDEFLSEMQDFDIPGFDEDALSQLYGTMDDAIKDMQRYGIVDEEMTSFIARAEAARSEAQDERVFGRDEVQNAPSTPSAPSNHDESLPHTVESTNGMVNIPKDSNTRPFIVCLKCGEKIWL